MTKSIVYGNSDQIYFETPGGSSVTAKYTTFEGVQEVVENKNAEDVIWKEGNAEVDPILIALGDYIAPDTRFGNAGHAPCAACPTMSP